MLSKDKNVLIVDDSALILDRLGLIFRKSGNTCRIFSAQTFSHAIDILSGNPIHIAIFDIHLQDENGIDLLREVKKSYPQIQVIMLTNQSSLQVEEVCLGLGARYFLDKSKDFSKIPQLIASLC